MIVNRNATIDVARGIAVLTMPSIHAVLIYGKPDVQAGVLGSILGFLAEGIAAPVFMLLMGVSVMMGRQKSLMQIFYRAAGLMGLGYLLNFLKFDIPILFGLMPPGFMLENNIPFGVKGLAQLFAMGDILQFASIGYFICSLIRRLKRYAIWAAFIGTMTTVLSPLLWQQPDSSKSLIGICYGLFSGQPPFDFFPVFPWITYPLIGLVIGYFLLRTKRINLYPALFMLGLALISIGMVVRPHEPSAWENDFYRLGPGGTLYHLGFAFVWLCFCQVLVSIFKLDRRYSFLTWSSKHITNIYIAQWTVVFWLLPVFGYQHLDLKACLFTMALTTVLALAVAYILSGLFVRQGRLDGQTKYRTDNKNIDQIIK